MARLRVAVVGVGHLGKEHARILAGLPGVELVGVADVNSEQAQAVGRRLGTPAYGDYWPLLNLVDAAVIAVPTSCHHAIAVEFLRRGIPLLIEKPIACNLEEADELVALAQEHGALLQVGHIQRFNPAFEALSQHPLQPKFVECERMGPFSGRSGDIGVVLDLMIHDLEVVLHLVRSPVKSVDAVGIAVLSKGEDIANARIRFENGCVANITASRISPEKMRKIRIFQQTAYVSLDYQNQTGEIYRLVDGAITRSPVEIEKDEPLKRELQSFVECSRRGGQPVVSGSEAAAALELAIEITELIKQGP